MTDYRTRKSKTRSNKESWEVYKHPYKINTVISQQYL